MRLVLSDVLVEHLPELVENGLVQVALGLREREHLNAELGHVRVQLLLLELQVERCDVREDVGRVAVPLPALELPRGTLNTQAHCTDSGRVSQTCTKTATTRSHSSSRSFSGLSITR